MAGHANGLAAIDSIQTTQRGYAPVADLTAFECRILELFASGLRRGEIAQALNRAPKTISNSLTAAKEKLGARSLAEATALLAAEALLLAAKTSP